MNDPIAGADDRVLVEDLSRTDAAADVALFLEGEEDVDGLIVATATAVGDEIVIVLQDAHDGSRTFRLRVVEG
jgi:hypothetical protein